jgi:hypothetical protein
MMGIHRDASHQERAQKNDQSSQSSAHECSIAKTVSRRVKPQRPIAAG